MNYIELEENIKKGLCVKRANKQTDLLVLRSMLEMKKSFNISPSVEFLKNLISESIFSVEKRHLKIKNFLKRNGLKTEQTFFPYSYLKQTRVKSVYIPQHEVKRLHKGAYEWVKKNAFVTDAFREYKARGNTTINLILL